MSTDLPPDIQALQREKSSLALRVKNLGSEIDNLIKAQGNLFRFQEKIERQRTIYEQLSKVAQDFNSSFDFTQVSSATIRFLIDHLNFQRALIAWVDEGRGVIRPLAFGGYYQGDRQISEKSWTESDPILSLFGADRSRLICHLETEDTQVREFFSSCSLAEGMAFGFGKSREGRVRGFLVFGNTRQNSASHAPVVDDPETNAILANITNQIVSAQNSLGFIQEIQRETERVKVESEKSRALLNNMNQAVFNIDAQAQVIEPVSRFTDFLFPEGIIGRSIFDSLYRNVDEKSELYTGIKTVLATAFGENEFQWELVNHLLPRKLKFRAQNSKEDEKIFKISYAPIWDRSELLEKIMFVIEDITEIERLEAQLREDRIKAEIIQEISTNDILSLGRNFFERSHVLFGKCQESSQQWHKDPQIFAELMRNLHSLKGNSRLFGFKYISQKIHSAESLVLESHQAFLRSPDALPLSQAGIEQALQDVEIALQLYGQIVYQYFRLGNPFTRESNVTSATSSESQMVEIYADNLRRLGELINKIPGQDSELQQIKRTFNHLRDVPLKPLLSRFQSMVDEVSKTLGKKVNYRITGDNVSLRPEVLEELQDLITHILRNSMDHGIENPEERSQRGKPEYGTLEIKAASDERHVCLRISDDGRGIDDKKLLQKALSKGLIENSEIPQMSRSAVLSLVFAPGLSTKDEVTELSGRGVGMDHVKKTLEALKGQIDIQSELGKGTSFELLLPLE
jgi:signal transduction histidine kinase